ncbi:MAG TPA: alpha/beta fold hydrolase [Bryobacteraceae bacterium]|jgi:pimeloyl-ACP methyl ester carboxylesterase
MPFVENQGARIYWDEQGEGQPVLMIMGLGAASALWWRTRPVLAANYRTIAFDNRGVGRSDVPPGPYSIPMMASDGAAVLDAAGVTRAHILGLSMGGMIAQEFALQYPARVLSLILGCTAAGGPNGVRAEPAATQTLKMRATLTREEAELTFIPFLYDDHTPPERVEEDLVKRRSWYATPEGYAAQLQAILSWQSDDRLPQITAPTLVVHGKNDRLVPPGNGERIASRIPGAELVLLAGANHMFTTDQPEAAHAVLLRFLGEQVGGADFRPADVP